MRIKGTSAAHASDQMPIGGCDNVSITALTAKADRILILNFIFVISIG